MTRAELPRFRRHLSAPGLTGLARECFERIEDPVAGRRASLADNMMAAPAMFMFRHPSLLRFDEDARGREACPEIAHNLKTLLGIRHVPCDTAMRERLDPVDPQALRPAFKAVFSRLQRGGGLKGLGSIDGTEFFASDAIGCDNCCLRRRRSGRTQAFHQMVCAGLADPETGAAIPFMPEMVLRGDGETKNDCEANAVKRLLPAPGGSTRTSGWPSFSTGFTARGRRSGS